MKSTENSYNKGLVSLDWDDLSGGKHGSRKKERDRNLQKRVKKLARNLGYQLIVVQRCVIPVHFSWVRSSNVPVVYLNFSSY